MHIDEIVDSIAGQFEKELDHVFKQQVRTNVISARAEAMRRYIDKHGNIPSSFLSQINFLNTVTVDVTEFCNEDYDIDIVRTEEKIPNPIRRAGKDNSFTYVGAVDNSKPYGFLLDDSDLNFILKDPFMTKCSVEPVFFTYKNDYLYIINDAPEEVRVRGPFSDLDRVAELNDCSGTGCGELYDVPNDLVFIIKALVYEEMRGTPIIPSNEEIEIKEEQ